jgi:glucose/mannose-6-phosphate isomerase
MSILDHQQKIKEFDLSDMASLLQKMPEQYCQAWKQSQKIKISLEKNIHHLVFCGLGGSGITGEIIKSLVSPQLNIPILVVQDKQLPGFVGPQSLVFLTSYSGQTAATISCAKQALTKGAQVFIITQGGELKKISQKNNLPCFIFDAQSPPRMSLPFLLIPALVVMDKLKLIDLKKIKIEKSFEKLNHVNQKFSLKTPTEKNIAKHLAYTIFDHLPVMITPSSFSGVARRWKTQLEENSKNFCFLAPIPEIFHNFVEAENPWRLKDDLLFLFFEKNKNNSSNKIKAFKKILNKNNIRWEEITQEGEEVFFQIIYLILLGDWTSFYLSVLNQVDPTPVKKIQQIKKK